MGHNHLRAAWRNAIRRSPRRSASPGSPTYYVDATDGDDEAVGTSEALAWKTLTKVNASSFSPGDTILFKRGETWVGTLVCPSSGEEGNPIAFGAYGEGAAPIIDAAARWTDWTLVGGTNKWVHDDNWGIFQVFEGDSRLIQAASYAAMVEGSWFQETSDDYSIWVWCADDADPRSAASVYMQQAAVGRGVFLNGQSYLVFNDIHVKRADRYGWDFYADDVANIICTNCVGEFCGLRGFSLVMGYVTKDIPDITFQSCVGNDSIGEGFWVGASVRCKVLDCEAYNSGKDCSKGYPWVGAGSGILAGFSAVDTEIRRCYVHDIYYNGGIFIEWEDGYARPSGCIVDRCWIHNDKTTMDKPLIDMGDDSTLTNNVVICTVGRDAVYIGGGAGHTILHNTIYHTAASAWALTLMSGSNIKVRNNLVMKVGDWQGVAVYAGATSGLDMDYNCYYRDGDFGMHYETGDVWASTIAAWRTATPCDDHTLFGASPLLVDAPTDMSIGVGSPCIGAGDDANSVEEDYDGVERPQGDHVDIGAYEYVAA